MTPSTLNQLFFGAIDRHRGSVPAALLSRHDDGWHPVDHATLLRRVAAVSAALRDLGVEVGDRVAILSHNRPEWAITDFACLTARCVSVPVYPTLPAEQVLHLLSDSAARVAFVADREQLDKVTELRPQLPGLEHIIVFDPVDDHPQVIGFDEFESRGDELRHQWTTWREEACSATAEDVATLIYTSGTTGTPKGVMLTHGNITSNVLASLEVMHPIRAGQSCLSFLPLSHIFERMAGHFTMFHAGVQIHYASSMDAVAAELAEVRPHVLATVPRLFEKIHARVLDTVSQGSRLKQAIFHWSRSIALRRYRYIEEGARAPWVLQAAAAIADRLVFRTIRARTGGRIEFVFSGGAPLNPDICRFFLAAGIPILEGYGLTETSPVMTANPPEKIKPGTVGPPIPGVEVIIANDGEILTRGPHVMKGYHNRANETSEAIDPQGWFHTGDIGNLDDDGYLRITDRKKDLIVTAGGKNIAPLPIEALLQNNPWIAHAVMIGDRMPYPVMLLVPNFEAVRGWAAARPGLPDVDDAALSSDPAVHEKLEREVRKSLRHLAQFEMPKKFAVLPRDFSIDEGELTPKLSVRRKVVAEHFKAEIAALYEDHTTS